MSAPSVQVYGLANAAGLRLAITNLGATWMSCSLPLGAGQRRELLLGCARPADYLRQPHYLGATIGRFSNRIRNARFQLDGREHRLQANQGPHQLHGGADGFHRRIWRLIEHSPTRLRLGLQSPDGDQGYPGELDAEAHFELDQELAMTLRLSARCSASCPVGLTQHAYFNLDGEPDDPAAPRSSCLDHQLQLHAAHWLPLDADGLPSGGWAAVGGSGMDFRRPRRLRDAISADAELMARRGLDHCFRLPPDLPGLLRPAAQLLAGDGRVALRLSTDQPALQVYSGNHLAGAPARHGADYPAHAGIALEPQWPTDCINHSPQPEDEPVWPDGVLRPGQVWQSQIHYRFEVFGERR